MKPILSIFLILLSIIFFEAKANSDDEILVDMEEDSSSTDTKEDNTSKGRRSAPRHIPCIIDFVNHTITISSNSEIEAYEIWNTDGEVGIASFDNEYDAVEFLSGVTGDYQIRLYSASHLYIGYVSLI